MVDDEGQTWPISLCPGDDEVEQDEVRRYSKVAM